MKTDHECARGAVALWPCLALASMLGAGGLPARSLAETPPDVVRAGVPATADPAPEDSHAHWETQSVRELMRQDLRDALRAASDGSAGRPDTGREMGVRPVLEPRLVAMYGVGRALMAEVQALQAANVEAIYNVTFGADLAKFVREGTTRNLFANKLMLGLLTGEPEYLDGLKDEAPKGWIVTGYPWYAIDTPAHNAFRKAYEARWGETLKMGSLVGYNTILTIAALLEKASGTDTDALVAAMQDLTYASPGGDTAYRAADHQATMGSWIGRTDVIDGKGQMTGWRYVDGAEVLPSPAEAKAMRPAN